MKDSLFIVADESAVKSLVNLANVSKYIPTQHAQHKTIDERILYELPITIPAFDFIGFIHLHPIAKDMKIVPASQMRTLLIKNINPIVPLIDVFTSLAKATSQLKRAVLLPEPGLPGVNKGVVEVEYQTHQAAASALESINGQRVQFVNGQANLEAFYAEPLVDNLKGLIERSTTLVIFENVNVNQTSPALFKEHLERFLLKNNEGHIRINKLRQYADKMVVEVASPSKSLQMLFNNLYEFNGVMLPVKAAMKPCVNVGKYKEKVLKLSAQALSEEDKMMLTMRLTKGRGAVQEVIRKKAEAAYNKLLQEEKAKELEKEKEKEKEKERERELANSRLLMNKKREREREKEKDREKEKESKKDYSSSKSRYDHGQDRDRPTRSKKHSSPIKQPQENNPNLSNLLASFLSQNLPNMDINQLVQLFEMNKTQNSKASNGNSLVNNSNVNEPSVNSKGNSAVPQDSTSLPESIPMNPSLMNMLLQQMNNHSAQQPLRSGVNDSTKGSNYTPSSQSMPIPQSVPSMQGQMPSYMNPQSSQQMYPSSKGVDPSQVYFMGMPNPVMYPLNPSPYPSGMNDFYLSAMPSMPGMNSQMKPDDAEMQKNLMDYFNQHYKK